MYKLVEIIGTSNKGFCDAVKSAIEEFLKEGKKIAWFEIVEQRGAIREGNRVEFQVKIKVGTKAEANKG